MSTQVAERGVTQLWGPPGIENSRNTTTRAIFTGETLSGIQHEIDTYKDTKPQATSEDILSFLLGKMHRDMQKTVFALTALNQFYIITQNKPEVKLEDISTIIIREDTRNRIQKGQGRGQGHLLYVIDWIKPPEYKPDPVTIQTPKPIKQEQVSTPYRFITQADRDAYRSARNIGAEQRRKEHERRKQERRIVEEMEQTIFDIGKEAGDNAIKSDLIRVVVKDGVARVYIKQYGFQKEFHELDMDNGVFEGVWKDEKWQVGTEFLRYLTVLAKKAEGEDVSYTPKPLTYDQCEITYELALSHGKIAPMKDADGNIVFIYEDSRGLSSLYFLAYQRGNVDLEKGLVVISPESTEGRPLHPDFLNFLKKKKIELESSSTQVV